MIIDLDNHMLFFLSILIKDNHLKMHKYNIKKISIRGDSGEY